METLGHVCITILAISTACGAGKFVFRNEVFENVEAFESSNMMRIISRNETTEQAAITENPTEAENVTETYNDCVKISENVRCPYPLISFYLYAGPNGEREFIDENDPNWFNNSNFDESKKTVLLIHGFGGGDDVGSVPLLRDAFIKTNEYNLINADWEILAKWPCYFQAVSNMKPVAKCTAHFLANLERTTNLQYEQITCVGFSLGAHICGLITNYVPDRFERIIALDPAKPLVQSKKGKDRLDLEDGTNIHVIHSNAGFFGMSGLQGTADVCINGGRVQSYCKKESDYNYCSHVQSLCYFAESLFPGKGREATPCESRCPYGSKFKPREGENIILGEPMNSSATGMYCVSATIPPYCKDPNSDDPDYGHERCCTTEGALVAKRQKVSISNFKLGQRPAVEDTKTEVAASLINDKKCIQKQMANMTCPDPHIKFYLYSGISAFQMRINTTSEEWFEDGFFQLDKPTVVLMHGYQGGENLMPTVILRDAIVKNDSHNLITVDYGPLTKERCDRQARLNAEAVAKCSAQLFEYLQDNGVQTEEFTCVGFGLGAHICGLIANFILPSRMQKIIALDPTGGRAFMRFPEKRLDPSDADAVHVFHSETRRFGEGESIGTADVCINNGQQPFCVDTINNQPRLCSHASSVCFLAESLFAERQVEPCVNRCPQPPQRREETGNPPMRENATFGASMESSAQGMYCLDTDEAPFCPQPDDDFGDPRCCILTKS
ncbi:uncharacterized protein LOC132193587 [Neocloeon triangulifer]|uniref:uncharacterized protein LOC132193587 n=1 Tax=Neocloeon triangulifer TaxID=2078957 RepID=UPI00286F5500|nr:uncharacterized protein LOC132193587 [Neocloeon triangulifer]